MYEYEMSMSAIFGKILGGSDNFSEAEDFVDVGDLKTALWNIFRTQGFFISSSRRSASHCFIMDW